MSPVLSEHLESWVMLYSTHWSRLYIAITSYYIVKGGVLHSCWGCCTAGCYIAHAVTGGVLYSMQKLLYCKGCYIMGELNST